MSNTDILNKTWTLSGSEENLSEEMFSDVPVSPSPKKNSTQKINHTINISPGMAYNSYTKQISDEYHQENVRNDLSMRSCYTSFNVSPKSTTFVKEDHYQYRSLNVEQPSYRNFAEIENFFKICNDDYVSLFDENTIGLDFE